MAMVPVLVTRREYVDVEGWHDLADLEYQVEVAANGTGFFDASGGHKGWTDPSVVHYDLDRTVMAEVLW